MTQEQGARKKGQSEEARAPPEMTIEEKLEYFDKEIKLIHDFCVKSGYNPREIERAASPFIESIKKDNRRKWKWRAISFSAFIAVAAVLFYCDPVYRFVCAFGRKTSIKILPYWDWTQVYEMECLVENPYYFHGNAPTEEDCEICEEIQSIERISNTTMKEISESYIRRDIPVIVEDGMRDWANSPGTITIDMIVQAYKNNPNLKKYMSCGFSSNVKVLRGNHRKFLRDVLNGDLSEYYAHWENCLQQAAKEMREFYQRPYFLPPMIELGESNWVYVSDNYNGKRGKPLYLEYPLVLMIQLKGKMSITLEPKPPCEEVCRNVTAVLNEGEIFLWTDFMYHSSYIPYGSGENVAIAVGGNYD